MSIKNKIKENSTEILYYILFIISIVFTKDVNIIGVSLSNAISLFLVLAITMMEITKGKRIFALHKETRFSDMIVLGFLAITLLKVLAAIFKESSFSEINMNFCILILNGCLMYFLLAGAGGIKECYLDICMYAGSVVTVLVLLQFMGVEQLTSWLHGLVSDSGSMAALLIFTEILSIYMYCTTENKIKSAVSFITSGLASLALCLNQNHVSLWVMVMFFMAVPCVFRPRASRVKKDMQLFFMFAFIWCNMSLLCNYTEIFKREAVYNLEQSVYMELLLAIGGVIFFHFWDRIPENTDLHKISLVRMRKIYSYVTGIIAVLFLAILAGGDSWKELPETGMYSLFRGIALPLVEEAGIQKSSFFIFIMEQGVVMAIFLLALFVLWGRRIRNQWQEDKLLTNILIFISCGFIFSFFVWQIPMNMVLVYFVFLLSAVFEKEEIPYIKVQNNYNERKGEESCEKYNQ